LTDLRRQGGVFARAAAILAVAGSLAACGGTNTTAPTNPTSVSETFNGTLAADASVQFPFNVSTTGSIAATLTSLTPQSTITVGFGIGQPSSGSCLLLTGAYSETEKVGQTISGTIAPGSYCVLIYDIGNIQGSDDFVITVAHP
jgi:hypothetical protein